MVPDGSAERAFSPEQLTKIRVSNGVKTERSDSSIMQRYVANRKDLLPLARSLRGYYRFSQVGLLVT